MKEFIINKNDAGQRLDKFIQKTVTGIPVSLMYKAIRLKKIKVNRKRAEQKQMLIEGDIVQMFLSEDLFSEKITDNELLTIKPQLDIVITHYGAGFAGLKLYRLADYTDSLAASHGNSDMSVEYIYKHIRKVIGDEYLIDEYKTK